MVTCMGCRPREDGRKHTKPRRPSSSQITATANAHPSAPDDVAQCLDTPPRIPGKRRQHCNGGGASVRGEVFLRVPSRAARRSVRAPWWCLSGATYQRPTGAQRRRANARNGIVFGNGDRPQFPAKGVRPRQVARAIRLDVRSDPFCPRRGKLGPVPISENNPISEARARRDAQKDLAPDACASATSAPPHSPENQECPVLRAIDRH